MAPAANASLLGNGVKVVSDGQDRYDRTIGEIYHDGTQINGSLSQRTVCKLQNRKDEPNKKWWKTHGGRIRKLEEIGFVWDLRSRT